MRIVLLATVCFLAFFAGDARAQDVRLRYSKLLATYDFARKIGPGSAPNNFQELFRASRFNNAYYEKLLAGFDTLDLYASYSFQGYPTGQKTPVSTIALLERAFTLCPDWQDFKVQTFGLLPSATLNSFTQTLTALESVYDTLFYNSHRSRIEARLGELQAFAGRAGLDKHFAAALRFYGAAWDSTVPIQIGIVLAPGGGGFSARAALNHAVMELPLDFTDDATLFSIQFHEICHNIYNEQSLGYKKQIERWFGQSPSPNAQYAYLLVNEALATAVGNGYIYEEIAGRIDTGAWYNVKYIDGQAKGIYGAVKEYMDRGKPIDEDFVNAYVAVYDKRFVEWRRELESILMNRYVVADDASAFSYMRQNYPYASFRTNELPIGEAALGRMQQTPVTKVVAISTDNVRKLQMVRAAFAELSDWRFDARKEFVHAVRLKDNTWLFVVNRLESRFGALFERSMPGSKVPEQR